MNAVLDLSPNLLLVAGVAGIFLAIGLALSVIGVATAEKRQIGKSLAALEAFSSAPKEIVDKELDRPFAERVLAPAGCPLHLDRPPAHRPGHQHRIQHRLDIAGNPPGWNVDRVLGLKAVGFAAALLLSLIVIVILGLGLVARRRRLRRPEPDRLLGAELLHLPKGLRPLRADAEGPARRHRPDDDLGRGRTRLRRRAVARRARTPKARWRRSSPACCRR